MALDPIHIGTGGYRLGRVDNTIVREPATNIPKIPGTTINGSARTYSYYSEKDGQEGNKEEKGHEDNNEYLTKACALGKEIDDNTPCGKCPICQTYGFTKGEEKSKASKVNFSDARILFFPVHSMVGPVWITCPSVLKELNISDQEVSEEAIKTANELDTNKLNLGWLYLEKEGDFSIPDNELEKIPQEIMNRAVLVSNKLFGQIANSNLEVRTSVSIDPETGAAESGALFTYEAIPRAAILWFEVNYREYDENAKKTVENGLDFFETLGVGGMSSRGFGRLKILNLEGGGDDQDD